MINALALWAAAGVVNGITLESGLIPIVIVAIVFGLVNAVLKPIAKLLTFPVVTLTLGLFSLVINAAMLWLTGALSYGLEVNGIGAALVGAVIVSVISWVCRSSSLIDGLFQSPSRLANLDCRVASTR